MKCKICQKEFTPNKYRPNQQICSQPACQRQRQLQNEREWRRKNPDYFKSRDQESAWRGIRSRYNRLWRESHKEELKAYETSHKEQHREYMREYMREYRKTHPKIS